MVEATDLAEVRRIAESFKEYGPGSLKEGGGGIGTVVGELARGFIALYDQKENSGRA